MDSMVEKLRTLMGEQTFEDYSLQGDQRKAENRRRDEEEASKLRAIREEVASIKAEEEAMVAAERTALSAVSGDNPWGNPSVTVDYASVDEIHNMMRPKGANRTIGEVAPCCDEFCPIMAVSRYPYKYMDASSAISDKVSKTYFASEKFWKKEWTLYYIYPPPSLSASPLILTPAQEVSNFLAAISTSLGCDLRLEGSKFRGLLIDFPHEDLPRPRYLGISNSKTMFNELVHNAPPNYDDHDALGGRSFEDWKVKIEASLETTKNKNKRAKAKKQQQRVLTKADWARQLRRTQRYLGLRETNEAESKGAYEQAQTSEERDAILNERALALNDVAPPKIDVTEPPLKPFDSNVVFVCIDVEVNERKHSEITEIGIAALDTASLAGVAPGKDGAGWHAKVKARHFIIKEYSHIRNSEYVTGCPDRFEPQFGTSEFISISDARAAIESCFEYSDSEGNPRTIILVGHDVEADVRYLRKLEVDFAKLPSVLEMVDTSNLYRYIKRMENPASLATVLYYFQIAGWHLHNAGNDAGYTLQALLSMAVHALTGELKTPTLEELIEKAKEEAAERIRENADEWAMAEAGCADDDGGVVVKTFSGSSVSTVKAPEPSVLTIRSGSDVALTSEDSASTPPAVKDGSSSVDVEGLD